MEYRKLGRIGLDISVISFGGVVTINLQQEKVNKAVSGAINRGVNLFDVGPTYGDAQNKMGPAIEKYRGQIILTCETQPEKTREEARADLENSFKLLKTDFFDVYQLHEVTDMDSLKLMEHYDFDTVMFPINWNYWIHDNQGEAVIKKARETNKGILAIKALAQRRWKDNEERFGYDTWYKPLFDNDELAELALKFTLSQDVDTAVCPGDERLLYKCLDLVEAYQGSYDLSNAEKEKLEALVDLYGGKLYPIVKS